MQTNVVMQTKHGRGGHYIIPICCHATLSATYTCGLHTLPMTPALTRGPQPALDYTIGNQTLTVRLTEIFYARERGQWHVRQSDRVCHTEPRPLCARLHHMGAPRVRCEPDGRGDTCSLLSSSSSPNWKKKERSEMKGNAGACGEGSPKCEWIMRSERRT